MAAKAVLPTKLLCCGGDVARHRLFKFLLFRQQAAEGSARHDLLLVVGDLFQFQTGQASKFPDRPLQHHRKTSADQLGIGRPELLDRENPHFLEALGDPSADTPDLPHLDRGKQVTEIRLGQEGEVANAIVANQALLRAVVGELGQRFRRADAHAHG